MVQKQDSLKQEVKQLRNQKQQQKNNNYNTQQLSTHYDNQTP